MKNVHIRQVSYNVKFQNTSKDTRNVKGKKTPQHANELLKASQQAKRRKKLLTAGYVSQWLYARSPVLVSKNGKDYDVTDCDAKGFEVALALCIVIKMAGCRKFSSFDQLKTFINNKENTDHIQLRISDSRYAIYFKLYQYPFYKNF
ncbi:hypothetical protein J6590_013320 [Homalodisca vitripennis]|nr:hypothetical protein J6590_013320 [Homalodisca vitripennis]